MFEWTPEYWQSWREAGNPHRELKSERDRHLALDPLRLHDGERVLEVGCGYGWITQALLHAAKIQWVGIDRSESMVRELRTKLSDHQTNALVADAHHLPFQSAAFDKILCTGVLMHVDDPFTALKEMVRLLRPQGLLVCSMNNALSPFSGPAMLRNTAKKGFVQKFHLPTTFRRYLHALGLRICGMTGDSVFATVSLSIGRFSFPPKRAFPVLKSLDQWAVNRFPWLAYEVWFVATKD